jgi:hypothetical protein
MAYTEAGRNFNERLHQYDETETKIYVGALGIVAPEIILPAIAELGTMVLAGETLTIAVEGAEAINVVTKTEEAVVILEEGANLISGNVIQFGKVENQISHAFRHVEEMGLTRGSVTSAIMEHLPSVISKIPTGRPLNSIITVAGKEIQYTAFRLSDNLINIRRIHGL